LLGRGGLTLEGGLQGDPGQLATGAEGGQLGDGQELAIGGGIGDHLQFASHGQGLLDEDRLQLGPHLDRSRHRSTSGIGKNSVIPEPAPNLQIRKLHPNGFQDWNLNRNPQSWDGYDRIEVVGRLTAPALTSP